MALFFPTFVDTSAPAANTKKAIVHISLPLETFAEILAFTDTEDLKQRLIFVSKNFAELTFRILRHRPEVCTILSCIFPKQMTH